MIQYLMEWRYFIWLKYILAETKDYNAPWIKDKSVDSEFSQA